VHKIKVTGVELQLHLKLLTHVFVIPELMHQWRSIAIPLELPLPRFLKRCIEGTLRIVCRCRGRLRLNLPLPLAIHNMNKRPIWPFEGDHLPAPGCVVQCLANCPGESRQLWRNYPRP
jgi:hypothetical protein